MPPSPPPTGIVVEAIVGEAPSRHFPGICSGRWKMSPQPGGNGVLVFGGWDFLPALFQGRVWLPFCLLVFLGFRRGWGLGRFPTTLDSQPGSRGVAK